MYMELCSPGDKVPRKGSAWSTGSKGQIPSETALITELNGCLAMIIVLVIQIPACIAKDNKHNSGRLSRTKVGIWLKEWDWLLRGLVQDLQGFKELGHRLTRAFRVSLVMASDIDTCPLSPKSGYNISLRWYLVYCTIYPPHEEPTGWASSWGVTAHTTLFSPFSFFW
jgi:hypothetical protein